MILPIKEKKAKVKKPFMSGYKTYDTSEGFGSVYQWKEAFEHRMNFCILTIKDKEESKGLLYTLKMAKDKKSLQKAYHILMMEYHPDIKGDFTGDVNNKKMSQIINEAYFELKNKF